jgi:hypothetical protein
MNKEIQVTIIFSIFCFCSLLYFVTILKKDSGDIPFDIKFRYYLGSIFSGLFAVFFFIKLITLLIRL